MLFKCENCGHTISDKALKCPKCKHTISNSNQNFSEVKNENNIVKQKSNPLCMAGFIFGVISTFFGMEIGILPLMAIILSSVGMAQFKNNTYKNKWHGIVGLILGILYMLANVAYYRHLL